MLELTGREIAELADDDLRTLIVLLGEEELRRQELPLSAITAGGDQNAPDGGIDVRISLPDDVTCGFVPRGQTGFQVKKPDMPVSAILNEMRPNGELRQSIRELADAKGAYIIVSAQGSVSDSSLRKRREAVHDGLGDHPNANSTHTDFYDRERIAAWVRQYPGLVAWVRNCIGRPISGWQPHTNWSRGGGIEPDKFLSDEKSRIFDGSTPKDGPLLLSVGIVRIRENLGFPRKSVRIIGLSGLGKTRLAEALFDECVAENALPRALALYSDIADEPQPSVRDMARHLVETQQRAILVVDNCPPETHRALTGICGAERSNVSLLTIEYDIRDDAPENTEVFRLEPASESVLEDLIEVRAPYISQNDRRRIAEFSGGNFRIALALAHTVQRGETLASFSDADLFERLFVQRQSEDKSLLHAAELLALIYSFDGEDVSDGGELAILAGFTNVTAGQLYSAVADLRTRGLVQSRSKWRAILPQALANRLATAALQRHHPSQIAELFELGKERLLRSFSRRLGFLHSDANARLIVEGWLSPSGLLGPLGNLNELGLAVLTNVSPVAPTVVLARMDEILSSEDRESVVSISNPARRKWAGLLRSFAYEQVSFTHAAGLLSKFLIAEPEGHNRDSTEQLFLELFQIYLSGTHATLEQRQDVIRQLVASGDPPSRKIGLKALRSMLKAYHFMSMADFSFGARPRDYGWQPTSHNERREWYSSALGLAQEIASEQEPLRSDVREIVASRFSELWQSTGAWKELAATVRAMAEHGAWPDAWIAVRQVLRRHGDMPDEPLAQLHQLEEYLQPQGLKSLATAYIFSEPWGSLDIADAELEDDQNPSAGVMRAFERAESLSAELTAFPDEILELLKEASGTKKGRSNALGRGYGAAIDDKFAGWAGIRSALACHPLEERNYSVAVGYLSKIAQIDSGTAQTMLDQAVDDEVFGPAYPMMQCSVSLGDADLLRLQRSLDLGRAQIRQYMYLSMGGATDTLPSDALAEFLLRMSEMEGGYEVAIDILHMRLFSERKSHGDYGTSDAHLIECGKKLLLRCDFSGNDQADYELAELVRWCFRGEQGTDAAASFCRNLSAALRDYTTSAYLYDTVVQSLFEMQPISALDELLVEDSRLDSMISYRVSGGSVLSVVPDDTLLDWASRAPEARFPLLAESVQLFEKLEEHGANQWSKLFFKLLESAPTELSFLEGVRGRLRPNSWSGSLAAILEDRRRLVDELGTHASPEVVAWSRETSSLLGEQIVYEVSRERREDESFE